MGKKRTKGNQGFASMDKMRHLELASQGGKTTTKRGTRHTWTPEQARIAAMKGVEARRHKKELQELHDSQTI